ncbi:MMPL family transporter [Methylomagnum sp.]
MPPVWRKRLFFLLLPLLVAATFLTAKVETDLNTFFTATDNEDAAFLAGFLQSGELSRRYLIAVEPKPGTIDNQADGAPSGSLPHRERAGVREIKKGDFSNGMEAFTTALVRELAALPGVERVWLADRPPDDWLAAVKSHAPHHARLYSLDPDAERDRLFDPGSLKDRAEGLRRALLSPQGALVKDIAKHDPLLLSLQAFRGLRDRVNPPPAARADFGGVVLQAKAPSLDTDAQSQLQAAIRDRFDRLNAASGGEFSLAMTGVPVFTVTAHDQIGRDVALVSAVSTVAVVLIFLALFRSFAAMHWVLLIVAASYAVGTLATALVFGTVHSLTLALGSTLTGVSIDYPMHVLAHASQHQGESATVAVRKVWPSLFIGALTTIVGYVALGFAGFPGFRQIAVFSAAAILATLALTRWVLPALLVNTQLREARLPGLSRWIGFCQRRRLALSLLLTAGLCGGLAVLPQMRWMDDLSSLAMDMSDLKRVDQRIRAHLSGVEPGRFVLISAPDLETALRGSEAVERRLGKLKESGGVKAFFGLYPWLASAELQAANAAIYASAVNDQFRAAWRKALADSGLAVDKLGTLVPSPEPLSAEASLAGSVGRILSGQIVRQPGGVALVIWLGAHQPAAVADAIAGIPGARYFSQKDLLDGLAQHYRDQSLVMLGWGLLAIYGLLWLRYRHPGRAFFSLFPALLAALSIFAAWAVLGQPVSFLHVMCLLLAVSICEDYGIFFLDNGGGDIHATYQAIAASMLTTVVSFAALGLAENPTLRIMAAGVTLGVALGFLLCPLLIREKRDGLLKTNPPA